MKSIIIILMSTTLFCSCGSKYERCTGDENCDVCTNCSRCKHCSKEGGSCGVCE